MTEFTLYSSTYPEEFAIMEPWLAAHRPALAVDLGTHVGGSCLRFARVMQTYGGQQVISIDANLGPESRDARANYERLREFFPDVQVTFVTGHLPEAITTLPDHLAFVFVDDHHDGAHVASELDLLLPKMAPGGVIFVHDANEHNGVGAIVRRYGGHVHPTTFGLGEIHVA